MDDKWTEMCVYFSSVQNDKFKFKIFDLAPTKCETRKAKNRFSVNFIRQFWASGKKVNRFRMSRTFSVSSSAPAIIYSCKWHTRQSWASIPADNFPSHFRYDYVVEWKSNKPKKLTRTDETEKRQKKTSERTNRVFIRQIKVSNVWLM